MCGIVAVVRRPPEGAPPSSRRSCASSTRSSARLAERDADRDAGVLRSAGAAVQSVGAHACRGPLGAWALITDPVAAAAFEHRAIELGNQLVAIEARLDSAARRRDRGRRRHRGAQRRARAVQGRSVGAAMGPARGGSRHRRSVGTRGAEPGARSRPTTRSKLRSRRSTGSKSAVVTPPACTCSSRATISIWRTPTSRG